MARAVSDSVHAHVLPRALTGLSLFSEKSEDQGSMIDPDEFMDLDSVDGDHSDAHDHVFKHVKSDSDDESDAATVCLPDSPSRSGDSPTGVDMLLNTLKETTSIDETYIKCLVGKNWLTGFVIERVGKLLVPSNAFFMSTGFLPDIVGNQVLQAKSGWFGKDHLVVPLEQAEKRHWTGE
jgi:hypothetical protein